MIDPERHAHDRNFIESILRYIPGFRGYLEKEYRRESDHLTREYLAKRLQSAKGKIDDLTRDLVAAGQLDTLPEFERLRTKIDGLIFALDGAVRGYSGIFDFVRVREEMLDKVYEHDLTLVDRTQAFEESLESLSAKPDAPQQMARDLIRRIDELRETFQQRSDLLAGLGPE